MSPGRGREQGKVYVNKAPREMAHGHTHVPHTCMYLMGSVLKQTVTHRVPVTLFPSQGIAHRYLGVKA